MARLNLHPDEAATWVASRTFQLVYFDRPPLTMYLMALFTRVTGDEEIFVRLPAWLLSIFSLYVLYRLGREMQGAFCGLLAVVWVSTCALILGLQFAANVDSVFLFFWTMGLYLFWKLVSKPSPRSWILLSLALGLGLYSKYVLILFFPSALLFLLLSPRDRGLLRQPWPYLALAIIFVFSVPLFWWNFNHDWINFGYHLQGRHHWYFSLSRLGEFCAHQFQTANPLLLVAMVIGLGASKRKRAALFCAAFCLPLLFFALTSLVVRTPVHWSASAYLSGSLLAALSLDSWLRRSLKIWLVGLGIAVYTVVFVVALPGIAPNLNQFVSSRWFSGWPQLAERVREVREGLDSDWLLASSNYRLSAELAYYLRDHESAFIVNPNPRYHHFGRHHQPPLGVNCIFVVNPEIQQQQVDLDQLFVAVEELPPFKVLLRERTSSYRLFLCRGFRGYGEPNPS